MSQPFDGYHKWLGIAPDEQPPHHYRLLGLKRFEGDPEVIDNAAERQMTHIRNAQTGKNAALSQKLLNEIAAARRVLLDPAQKRTYDQQLKRQEPRRNPLPQAQALPPSEPVLDDIAEAVGPHRRSRRTQPARTPLLAAAAGLLALAAVGGWYLLNDHPSPAPSPVAQRPPSGTPPAEQATAHPAPRPDQLNVAAETSAPIAASSERPADIAEPAQGEPTSEANQAPSQVPEPAVADSSNKNVHAPVRPAPDPAAIVPPAVPVGRPSPSNSDRWPVPDEAALTAAGEPLQTNYAREMAAASSKSSRISLAKKLLTAASLLSDEQATGAERYALMTRASKLAVEAEDLKLALAIADQISSRYAVDRVDQRLAVYESLARHLKAPQARVDLAERLADEGAEAILLDLPQRAEAILATFKRNAVPFKQPALKKRIESLASLASKRRAEQLDFEQAAAELAANPDDPSANRLAGIQQCLRKEDFPAGLTLLAKSGDERLAALVELEQAKAASAVNQAQLADKWWDYAAHAKADLKTVATRRALGLYETALPELPAALRKKAEKRLLDAKDPLAALLPRTLTVSLADDCELRLKLILPGSFIMGSSTNEANRGPDEAQHPVLLTRPFYISETELTQLQTQRSTGDLHGFFPGDPAVMPAAGLSWHSCQAICDRLSQIGAARGLKFRLPTEAEWEYACRAGTTTAYSCGDSPAMLNEYAWSRVEEDMKAHPVATRKPNPFGVYDMHGNLNEWCADWYGPYPAGGQLVVNPRGPLEGTQRVWRGGSWYESAPSHRSAARFHSAPGSGDRILGIRVVCDRAF